MVGGAARQLLPGLLLACAALLTQGCRLISQPTPMGLEYHAFEREVLGRTVRIDMYTLDGEQAELAANAAFARVKEVEQRTNDRHGISELRTAAAAAGSWMPLSSDLFRTLEVALETARLSNGAFDPTVGPYVMLWNETRTRNSLPAPERRVRGCGQPAPPRPHPGCLIQVALIKVPHPGCLNKRTGTSCLNKKNWSKIQPESRKAKLP